MLMAKQHKKIKKQKILQIFLLGFFYVVFLVELKKLHVLCWYLHLETYQINDDDFLKVGQFKGKLQFYSLIFNQPLNFISFISCCYLGFYFFI